MGTRILIGDVRERLKDEPDESIHCVVTSPPYFGLRDYGCSGQIGLEPTPERLGLSRISLDAFRNELALLPQVHALQARLAARA